MAETLSEQARDFADAVRERAPDLSHERCCVLAIAFAETIAQLVACAEREKERNNDAS